jgi:CHAD domain-containing protein
VQEVIYTHKIAKHVKMFAKRYKLEALKEKYSSENKIKKVQKICTKLKKIDEHLLPIKNRIQTGE